MKNNIIVSKPLLPLVYDPTYSPRGTRRDVGWWTGLRSPGAVRDEVEVIGVQSTTILVQL